VKRAPLVLAALMGATFRALASEADAPAPSTAASLEANPLSAITPEALSATRDRPLFSPSRRPPPPIVVVAPTTKPVVTIETKPAAPERPPFVLLGTIVGMAARVALLQDRGDNAVVRLREGESQAGWRAFKVDARSIVLRKGENSATLELPKPGDVAVGAPIAAAPVQDALPADAPAAKAPLVGVDPSALPRVQH
jgi:hypothetical protein